MVWSNISKAPLTKSERLDPPEGLWYKCVSCQEVIYRKDFEANQYVCHKCNDHSPIPAHDRIRFFCDPESFRETDQELRSVDPLNFFDKKSYAERLTSTVKHTGLTEALISGEGKLKDRPIHLAVFDFRFMGGSMGSVVGEKIARVFQRACKERQPAIVFSSSGGARMQEGLLSLMQMAKTCAALAQMRHEGVPMISVMTNPTTGGVAASYAMLGDINCAEPKALIGFAGPRVIQQTIGQSLPEGFQTAEYLFDHGMLDFICHRQSLRDRVAAVLSILVP